MITATEAVAVSVTAAHIAAGIPEDCERDAISLAVREIFAGKPYVDEDTCIITDLDGTETEYHLDLKARESIVALDKCQPVAPFTFTMTLAGPDGDLP